MLQEVAHPDSAVKWRRIGKCGLMRPKKRCSTFDRVNQKLQKETLPAGDQGIQAEEPEGVRECQSIGNHLVIFIKANLKIST